MYDRERVLETYTFIIKYSNEDEEERVISGLEIEGPDGRRSTVGLTTASVVYAFRVITEICKGLPMLTGTSTLTPHCPASLILRVQEMGKTTATGYSSQWHCSTRMENPRMAIQLGSSAEAMARYSSPKLKIGNCVQSVFQTFDSGPKREFSPATY